MKCPVCGSNLKLTGGIASHLYFSHGRHDSYHRQCGCGKDLRGLSWPEIDEHSATCQEFQVELGLFLLTGESYP